MATVESLPFLLSSSTTLRAFHTHTPSHTHTQHSVLPASTASGCGQTDDTLLAPSPLILFMLLGLHRASYLSGLMLFFSLKNPWLLLCFVINSLIHFYLKKLNYKGKLRINYNLEIHFHFMCLTDFVIEIKCWVISLDLD